MIYHYSLITPHRSSNKIQIPATNNSLH